MSSPFLRPLSYALLLCAGLSVYAQTTVPPQLSADRLFHEDGLLRAEGNACFSNGTFALCADEIAYEKDTHQATASGEVTLVRDNARLVTPKIGYDATNGNISGEAFRAGDPPFYMEGAHAHGGLQKMTAEDLTFYYHDPDPFSVNLRAERATYLGDGTAVLEDATLRIGKVPLFYIGRYEQEQQSSPVHVKLKIGSSDNRGAYVQSTLYYNHLRQGIDPGLLFDTYSKRGVLAGPALRYDLKSEDSRHLGHFQSGFIDDNGNRDERGTDLLGRPIDDGRHFLNWQHKSRLGERLDLTATTHWWSDSEVLRDFRENDFRNNQQPDSFVEAVYRGDHYLASAFGRYRPNDFQTIQERLPEVRLDHLPYALGDTGVYTELQLSAARLYEKDPQGLVAEMQSDRLDYYQGLRRPWKPINWATITPLVGTRVTHYRDALGGRSDFTRVLGEVGLDAEMTAHGKWDVENDFWDVHDLRHFVRPRLQYRYIPEAQSGANFIPAIERHPNTTLLPPIDLANLRELDDLYETHLVRLGVENTLETRAPDYGSRTLASMNFFHDYRFTQRPGENDYGELHSEFTLSPAYWLRLETYHRLDSESLTGKETRTRVRLTDADVWEVTFSSQNLQHDTDQYELGLAYKLNEDYRARTHWRYDTHRGEFTEQVYALSQRIGHSWIIEYALSVQRGDNRQDGIGFGLRIELLDF